MVSFEEGFPGWGISRRNDGWYDIYMKEALEIGTRPDITTTAYNKMLDGKVMRKLPSLRRYLEAVIRKGDIEWALDAFEAWCQLDELPAPDTTARTPRDVRRDLKAKGYILTSDSQKSDPSFDDYMLQVEKETGNHLSGIEARFKVALKKKFRQFIWVENKPIKADHGPFRGLVLRPDEVCERLELVIELDSLEWHLNARSFTSDRKRVRFFQYLGYTVLVFSGRELSIPNGFTNAFDEIQFHIDKKRLDTDAENGV